MSARIRSDGTIVCAAMFPAEPGDTYINDHLHHLLHQHFGILVAEPHERHRIDGRWWWLGQFPADRTLESGATDCRCQTASPGSPEGTRPA